MQEEAEPMDVTPSEDYLDREIPDEIARALSNLAGRDGVATTLAGALALTDSEIFSPGEVTADDLLTTENSRHEVDLPDRTVNTYCILDALVLPFLEEVPVEIATRPPEAEEPIEFTASPQGIQGAPPGMVVSFGFSTQLPTGAGAYEDRSVEETIQVTHRYGCPKINLFPDREAYEDWAGQADAVVFGIPLPEALGLARDTARAWKSQAE